jgi:hypothetical protein
MNSCLLLTLADLDDDQDLDAFCGEAWRCNVFLNNGDATFVETGQLFGDLGVIASGDVDDDGDVDVVGSRVLLNDGTGTFLDSGQSITSSDQSDLKMGDLDGDDDLDVLVLYHQFFEVWLNDGNGVFSNTGQSILNLSSHQVEIGDLDNDQDLDVFLMGEYSKRVLLNNGDGTFTGSGQVLEGEFRGFVTLADFDGDGDLDAFSSESHANFYWMNNGEGIFTLSWQDGIQSGWADPRGVLHGDFDSDGDPDVIHVGYNQTSGVWADGGVLFNVSAPASCVGVCGDGLATTSEQCDGDNLNGESCSSLVGQSGILRCDPLTCEFDTSDCH